jgi:phosphomannomutase
VLAVLCEARGAPLSSMVAALPRRVTYSDRIIEFPVAKSRAILDWLEQGSDADRLARASKVFGALAGDAIAIDRTDGLRMTFADGAIIHLRPSGNAPELRCYTEADTEQRARQLNVAALGLVRDGIAPAP